MEPLVYCNEGCGKTYARINRNTPHSNRYGASVAETTYNIIYTSGMYHDSLALKTSTFSLQNHENTFANMSLPDLDSIANIMIIQ